MSKETDPTGGSAVPDLQDDAGRDQAPIVRELRRFVDTQAALVAALHRAAGGGQEFGWIREMPWVGEVDVDAHRWRYRRHGGGVAFHEPVSGREIDVHDKLDRPRAFDGWRLEIYFRSLGRTGIKLLERACGRRGISARDAVALLLPQWREMGVLLDTGGALTLA